MISCSTRELGPRFFVSAPTACITVSWLLPMDANRFLVPRIADNIETFDPVPSQPTARVRASQHATVLQLAVFRALEAERQSPRSSTNWAQRRSTEVLRDPPPKAKGRKVARGMVIAPLVPDGEWPMPIGRCRQNRVVSPNSDSLPSPFSQGAGVP
jgi:hypothetical protein